MRLYRIIDRERQRDRDRERQKYKMWIFIPLLPNLPGILACKQRQRPHWSVDGKPPRIPTPRTGGVTWTFAPTPPFATTPPPNGI